MFDAHEPLDLNDNCAPPHLNERIAGKYLIQEQLGSGTSARVYSAKVYPGSKLVAIKILRERSSTSTGEEMLAQEGLALMKVDHPCFVKVHDFGKSENGEPFLVMDLVRGQTLKSILKDYHSLPLDRALDLSILLLDSLHHLHGRSIVHASFKPSDILVLDGERCSRMKLIDLDSVSQPDVPDMQSKTLLGEGATFHYMSPEQANGQPVDERSDMYSFAIVLYEMVTGRRPFDGGSVVEVFNNKASSKIVPFSASKPELADSRLERVLRRCLQARKENRYQHFPELQDEIEDLRESTPTTEEHHIDTKCWKKLPRSAYADRPMPEKATWIAGFRKLIGG